jgi:hypothetical protein
VSESALGHSPSSTGLRDRVNQWARPALIFALACLAYFLCLRFVFPGYFHPLYPHHNDFYSAPGLSANPRPLTAYLHWPRPLGFLFMDIVGRLGLQGYMLVVALVSLANAALVVHVLRRLTGIRADYGIALCYFALLFVQPGFYINYIHDTLATLSLCYLLLAVLAWCAYRESGKQRWLGACAALFFLIAFTKETYFVSAAVLFLGLLFLAKPAERKACLGLLAVLGVFEVAGLWANTHSVNPFVDPSAGGTSAYYISFAPGSVIRLWWAYLKALLNPVTAALAALALVQAFRLGRTIVVGAVSVLAGICAVLPHTVIPNHFDSTYASVAAPLVFLPVLLLTGILPRRTIGRLSIYVVLVLAFIGAIRMNGPQYAARQWTLAQEKVNRNVLKDWARLKALPASDRKILVAGIKSPFQPFYVSDYIRFEFGRDREWTVITPREFETQRQEPVTLVHAAGVDVAAFDHAFVFDEDGRLAREWTGAQLREAAANVDRPIPAKDEVLVPALAPVRAALAAEPDKWFLHLRAGVLFWEWGDPVDAETFLLRSAQLSEDKNPYPFYFLGLIRESERRPIEARALFEKAVALDGPNPNPALREALGRIKTP